MRAFHSSLLCLQFSNLCPATQKLKLRRLKKKNGELKPFTKSCFPKPCCVPEIFLYLNSWKNENSSHLNASPSSHWKIVRSYEYLSIYDLGYNFAWFSAFVIVFFGVTHILISTREMLSRSWLKLKNDKKMQIFTIIYENPHVSQVVALTYSSFHLQQLWIRRLHSSLKGLEFNKYIKYFCCEYEITLTLRKQPIFCYDVWNANPLC